MSPLECGPTVTFPQDRFYLGTAVENRWTSATGPREKKKKIMESYLTFFQSKTQMLKRWSWLACSASRSFCYRIHPCNNHPWWLLTNANHRASGADSAPLAVPRGLQGREMGSTCYCFLRAANMIQFLVESILKSCPGNKDQGGL